MPKVDHVGFLHETAASGVHFRTEIRFGPSWCPPLALPLSPFSLKNTVPSGAIVPPSEYHQRPSVSVSDLVAAGRSAPHRATRPRTNRASR